MNTEILLHQGRHRDDSPTAHRECTERDDHDKQTWAFLHHTARHSAFVLRQRAA